MRFDVCVVKITNMFNCVSVVGVMLPIDILKIFVCVVSEEFFFAVLCYFSDYPIQSWRYLSYGCSYFSLITNIFLLFSGDFVLFFNVDWSKTWKRLLKSVRV